MAKQVVNVGTVANDGTGDALRDAFEKLNNNFTEAYSAFAFPGSNNATLANNLNSGNSTINSTSNSTTFVLRVAATTSTLTASTFTIGNSTVNAVINSTTFAAGANVVLTTARLKIGNSTVNSSVNSTAVQITGTASTVNVLSTGVYVGNSTVNASINTTTMTVQSGNVFSNTFALGSSNTSANGYTRLPNGLLMQWGKVAANSTVGDITFVTGFTTLLSLQVTGEGATYDATYRAQLTASNTTTANVRTGNATSINVTYTAIGL